VPVQSGNTIASIVSLSDVASATITETEVRTANPGVATSASVSSPMKNTASAIWRR